MPNDKLSGRGFLALHSSDWLGDYFMLFKNLLKKYIERHKKLSGSCSKIELNLSVKTLKDEDIHMIMERLLESCKPLFERI